MAKRHSTQNQQGRNKTQSSNERNWEEGGNGHNRGLIERAGDEVRSWLGDSKAELRRHRDEYEMERRARQGKSWSKPASYEDVRAGHVMTRDVTTVTPNDRIERAARLMRECDCGALPVTDYKGQLIGMLTDRDIATRLVARGVDIRQAIVADCMTTKTYACHANDLLEDCLHQMARHRVRRLPIVNDDNQVIGIVSQSDLARHADAWQGHGQRRDFAHMVSDISEPSARFYR